MVYVLGFGHTWVSLALLKEARCQKLCEGSGEGDPRAATPQLDPLDLRAARFHLVYEVLTFDPTNVETPSPCEFWKLVCGGLGFGIQVLGLGFRV
jgi:hypothetical protein